MLNSHHALFSKSTYILDYQYFMLISTVVYLYMGCNGMFVILRSFFWAFIHSSGVQLNIPSAFWEHRVTATSELSTMRGHLSFSSHSCNAHVCPLVGSVESPSPYQLGLQSVLPRDVIHVTTLLLELQLSTYQMSAQAPLSPIVKITLWTGRAYCPQRRCAVEWFFTIKT